LDRSFLKLWNGIRHVMPSTDRRLELKEKASMAQNAWQASVYANGLMPSWVMGKEGSRMVPDMMIREDVERQSFCISQKFVQGQSSEQTCCHGGETDTSYSTFPCLSATCFHADAVRCRCSNNGDNGVLIGPSGRNSQYTTARTLKKTRSMLFISEWTSPLPICYMMTIPWFLGLFPAPLAVPDTRSHDLLSVSHLRGRANICWQSNPCSHCFSKCSSQFRMKFPACWQLCGDSSIFKDKFLQSVHIFHKPTKI